ncbi:Beta-lactamase OXA-10 [Kordia antarctica]|uniref:Beta-lactamase n=1 Tax=Kordia antarctica TaxID=1218801 RepID=A0A7L4ZFP0_9FLAO|nr:penicillin-binding transpeptidase domain-containing protein [Kordia antarctica]QHI35435.1 Beta-lactamase OXA-10 [Kordia antarctica]
MKNKVSCLVLLCVICLLTNCKQTKTVNKVSTTKKNDSVSRIINNHDFKLIIEDAKLDGSILIFDPKKSTFYSNDFQWARTSRPPASTFKIVNSIIGLETGLIKGEDFIFKWNGKYRVNPAWRKDLTFREAFQLSCVPCYQELAKEIGAERMKYYVSKIQYGNMKIDSTNIDTFWFEKGSYINQFQQIAFLERLYNSKLPISQENEMIVKKLILIEKGDDYVLYGKTGRTIVDKMHNGWFVGYMEKNNQLYYFATNINPSKEVYSGNFYSTIKKITIQALEKNHSY